jgi:CheY-like chemotaxis protein
VERQVVKKKLEVELSKWLTVFEKSQGKINEIIAEFINETPQILRSLRISINEKDWKSAARISHKVKVRYSYIGFDDLFNEIDKWENAFTMDSTVETIQHKLDRVDEQTTMIIEELKLISGSLRINQSNNTLPLAGKLILVAEDDQVNALIFEAFIIELGGKVILAQDGYEAFNQTLQKSPDLIFMDVHMPYFNGLDAIKKIRKNEIKTPIVSLSASSGLNERDESMEAGANDFLLKPADQKAIQSVLLKFLN